MDCHQKTLTNDFFDAPILPFPFAEDDKPKL